MIAQENHRLRLSSNDEKGLKKLVFMRLPNKFV